MWDTHKPNGKSRPMPFGLTHPAPPRIFPKLFQEAVSNYLTHTGLVTGATPTQIEIAPGALSSNPSNFVGRDGTLYLSAFDGIERELWHVGNATASKIDLFPGTGTSQPSHFYAGAEHLYFAAWGDINSGSELWKIPFASEESGLPPIAANDVAATVGETALTINVLDNDSDPQDSTLTIAQFTQPAHGSVNLSGDGSFTYTPASGYAGVDYFVYTLANSHTLTDTATVVVVVAPAASATDAPLVLMTTPGVTNTFMLNSQGFAISLQAAPDAYSGTIAPDDLFFLVFTSLITPTSEAMQAPRNLAFAGMNFSLNSYLNNSQLEKSEFAPPLLLTVEYPPSLLEGGNAEGLRLLYWEEENNQWSGKGIEVISYDLAARRITFALHHLSDFALFAPIDLNIFMPRLFR